ncbi:MAG TPA: aminoglycoside phosphotransferase family protein [Myxococcota bacterium]|nr:aminoglycoside phosphotransferase family protein [Myxococcota bacterium]
MDRSTDAEPLHDRVAEAASLVGRRVGVEFDSADILALGRRTVIRLLPAPVVAKVAAGSCYRALEREVAVARHVAMAGGPADPPLDSLAVGPHREAEFAVTLWRYFPALTPPLDIEAGTSSYLQLREALDSYAGDLPDYAVPILECARALRSGSVPRLTASQMDLLRRVLDAAPDRMAARDAVSRPLHGDPHLGNLLFTKDGPLWLDFESACRGPIEWDLSAFSESGLLPRHDAAALTVLRQVRSACVVVWCICKDHPSIKDQEAAAFHIAQLEGTRLGG